MRKNIVDCGIGHGILLHGGNWRREGATTAGECGARGVECRFAVCAERLRARYV